MQDKLMSKFLLRATTITSKLSWDSQPLVEDYSGALNS